MKKNEFERRRERWQTISSVGRGDSQLTVNVREGVSFELGGGKNSPCAGSYMCHARVLIGSGLMQGSSMFFGERDMEQAGTPDTKCQTELHIKHIAFNNNINQPYYDMQVILC